MKAKDLWSAADKHVQKGDYIKLRDVTLGYTIPTFVEKIHDSRYPPECTGNRTFVLGRQ